LISETRSIVENFSFAVLNSGHMPGCLEVL
jgi:hypothetical protein